MYGFVASLKAQTSLAFKERLRGIDLLILDDVQFIQGKQIQQEFGHTINALIDAGRQIVVAADRPPADLEALDERVRSRLAGGLVVEIGALDEALRASILSARLAARARRPPDLRGRPGGGRLRGAGDHGERARSRRRGQPAARPRDADRLRHHARDRRDRDPRSRAQPRAEARQDRGHPEAGGLAATTSPARTSCRSGAPPPWCGRARSPCTCRRC